MSPLRARVENGRLHLDEPTDLPEGTELELVVDDDGGDLTDIERHALPLLTSWSSAEAGKSRPVSALNDELRRQQRTLMFAPRQGRTIRTRAILLGGSVNDRHVSARATCLVRNDTGATP